MTYGENHYSTGIFPTVHAEDDAVNKLPVLKRNRRLKKVDLLVIRANAGGTVGNSRPCDRCIKALEIKLPKKGYTLDTLYYTDKGGILIKKKFAHVVLEEDHHVSKYFK
jgi:hypothetical protein